MKKTSIALMVCAGLLIGGIAVGTAGFFISGGRGFYVDTEGAHYYELQSAQQNQTAENVSNKPGEPEPAVRSVALETEKRLTDKQSLADFHSVQGDFVSGEVTLVESDHFGIEYDLSGQYEIRRIEVADGTLYADIDMKNMLTFFQFNLGYNQPRDIIKIYYPSGTSFGTLDIDLTSGSITAKDLETENTKISITSGNCSLEGTTGDLHISQTSGSIQVSRGRLSTLAVESTSGDFTIMDTKVDGEAYLSTTSGTINLNGTEASAIRVDGTSGDVFMTGCKAGSFYGESISGYLSAENLETDELSYFSTSGDIELSGTFRGKSSIRSTSGKIMFSTSLPESEYSYMMETISGDTRANGSNSSGHNVSGAANMVAVNTTSGDIELSFAR